MASFSLKHMDYKASTKSSMDNYLYLDYSLVLNNFGVAIIKLPTTYNFDRITVYDRIRITRNGIIEGNTDFFVLDWGFDEDTDSSRSITIKAFTANWLLNGPHARYYDGHAMSSYNGYADDALKQIVRENGGSLTEDTGRAVPYGLLTVDADLSQSSNSIEVYYAERKIADVLKEIAEDNSLYYDIVLKDNVNFIFKTYTNLYGQDKTGRIKFSKNLGNLIPPLTIHYDYTQEITQAYAGGPGEGADRIIKTASDTVRHEKPFARLREAIIDAADVETPDGIQTEANKLLAERKAKVIVTGTIIDTSQAAYGTDWGLGDKVTVEHRGLYVYPIITNVHINHFEHNETITATITGDV